jgi:hypothetical protein
MLDDDWGSVAGVLGRQLPDLHEALDIKLSTAFIPNFPVHHARSITSPPTGYLRGPILKALSFALRLLKHSQCSLIDPAVLLTPSVSVSTSWLGITILQRPCATHWYNTHYRAES